MKYLFTMVALLLCLPLWAQRYGRPRPIYTEDPGGYIFMGYHLRPMKPTTTDGVEISVNTRAFAGLHFGLYYCFTQERTKELYGYHIKPDLAMLSTTTLGLDVSYRFPIESGMHAFVISCTACPEFITLNEKITAIGPQRVGWHSTYIGQKVARNAFYSLRPGIRFYTLQQLVMMGVHYNFLAGTPRFGAKEDFEGLQYILSFSVPYGKKGKSFDFY